MQTGVNVETKALLVL